MKPIRILPNAVNHPMRFNGGTVRTSLVGLSGHFSNFLRPYPAPKLGQLFLL